MFFPLSFYIFLSIGTLSLASHLPNSFQVRDFYVKIFPTVFFVFKAASLGEIDQREETVHFYGVSLTSFICLNGVKVVNESHDEVKFDHGYPN